MTDPPGTVAGLPADLLAERAADLVFAFPGGGKNLELIEDGPS